ncbi:MAG: hypothetical protein H6839_03525 [Planctomycetes bacterium]|nr:hypothetical protein [Planctomycetota bacterium]
MSEETTKPEGSPAAAQETKSSEAGLPAEQKAETTIPDTGELKVPLWIKLMWLGFVIWIIWYVVMGLQSSPDSWA